MALTVSERKGTVVSGLDDDVLIDLDLRTLAMIVAIDQAGSMTGAAKLLGYSQPAISQHLRRAEARLGVPLVRKVGRTSRLTEAGRVVLQVAPGITQGLQFASSLIRDIRSVGLGRLRLAGFRAATAVLVPGLLARLRTDHPGTDVSYRELEPMDAIELICASECEAAIVYRFPRSEYSADWFAEELVDIRDLFQDPMYVALPAGHPLAETSRVRMSELSSEVWIGPGGAGSQCLQDFAREAGFEPNTIIETDNVFGSLRLVAQGFGASLVSHVELRGVPAVRGVQTVPLVGASRMIAVASAVHQRESVLVQAVLRAMRRAQGVTPGR